MTYYGNEVFYRGHLRNVKEITLLNKYLLLKFDNGKVISYDLDIATVVFEEDKHGKSK